LEAIAWLFGLVPAPARTCRVLELGCGDGANALSIAQSLPGASVLGIDAAAGPVARGTELARAAGLRNAELRVGDIEALPGDLGSFDYIIAHGVYSWISAPARAALLAAVQRHLAPEGVAYVSYNAYPGSHVRSMAREILRYHVRGEEDPERRLGRAQELMRTIIAIETPSPYAQVLREHVERMLCYGDALLLHDDLAEISTPFYFHEFVEHAAHHHLGFLAEADLYESRLDGVPESAVRLMSDLPEDVVAREQYLDFFKNRMFRKTLLCHEHAPVRRDLDDVHLERLVVSAAVRSVDDRARVVQEGVEARPVHVVEAPAVQEGAEVRLVEQGEARETFVTAEGFTMTTSEPHVSAAMRALGDAWPQARELSVLLEPALAAAGPGATAERVAARLRAVLLEAYLARVVQLHGCPPPVCIRPGERPCASALARAQCATGTTTVSSLLHATVRLEGELEPTLLPLLDGTRDLPQLAQALAATSEQVQTALERFASVGLLQG
jgi:SAM-dependent methyltransferase